MRAAIYTRFSSDKQREASTQDQRRKGEARALAEGWDTVELFADEAISGSRADRPAGSFAPRRRWLIVYNAQKRSSRESKPRARRHRQR